MTDRKYVGKLDMNGNRIYVGDYVQVYVQGEPKSINKVYETPHGDFRLSPCGCGVGMDMKIVEKGECQGG